MSGIRLLVCGGRNFQDRDRVFSALDRFLATWPVGLLIHGAVRGADKLAGEWAKSRGIPVRDFPADWDRYRRAAGPRRNQQMLDEGRPHGVVAFPGKVGTPDMVDRAKAAGLPVWRPCGDEEAPG
jgi:hypothetical protein